MPEVINQTIWQAKKFLEKELRKYNTYNELKNRCPKSGRTILGVNSEPAFRKLKGDGIGEGTILKFLGGNFKSWMMQNALATLTDDEASVIKFAETDPRREQSWLMKGD